MGRAAEVWRLVRDGGRLMVGVKSYDAYLDHFREHHPGGAPMSEVEFFRNRQAAQYGEGGKGGFTCC